MNDTEPCWWEVNIGSGNGLVPLGNKPLPEPMLTQFLVAYGVARPQWVKQELIKPVNSWIMVALHEL